MVSNFFRQMFLLFLFMVPVLSLAQVIIVQPPGTTLGVPSTATIASAPSALTAAQQRANALSPYMIDVTNLGAKADWTGTSGQGTDNSSVFQTAMGTAGNHVWIPQGSYRFTTTLTPAGNVYVECAGRDTTNLWFDDPTGTADAISVTNATTQTIGQFTFENCGIYSANARSSAVDNFCSSPISSSVVKRTAFTIVWR